MRIIRADSFDRENHLGNEYFVAENVKEHFGIKMVKLLNDNEHNKSDDYFKLVEDNYELRIFIP